MFEQTQPIRGRYEQRSLLQTCLRLRTIWDTMAYRDWSGHQIYNPSDPLQKRMRQYLGYVQENMAPIVAKSVADQQRGTGISSGERFNGIKPASAAITKPRESGAGIARANAKAQYEAERFRERIRH